MSDGRDSTLDIIGYAAIAWLVADAVGRAIEPWFL